MGEIRNRDYRWPARRTGPVLDMIRARDGELDLRKISQAVGMKPGAMSAIFVKDDMKLSKAILVGRCYGYELELSFPPYIPEVGLVHDRKRTFENAGQLAGLADYIQDRYGSILEASRRIGCDRSLLYTALTAGDILLSRLYTITDTLGITVEWRWIPIQ